VRGSNSMAGRLGEGETRRLEVDTGRWREARRWHRRWRDRGWVAAPDADAEAAAQRARTGVEAAWMGLGGAALELKDRRLGVDSSSGDAEEETVMLGSDAESGGEGRRRARDPGGWGGQRGAAARCSGQRSGFRQRRSER
jgi:hypothetical protein